MLAKIFLFLFLMATIAASIYFFIINGRIETKLISPISAAKFTTVLGIEDVPESNNIWLPEEINISDLSALPQISAKAAYVVDLTTDQTIYAKNIHEKQAVASTVKIMTALIALERKKPNEIFSVSGEAAVVGEDSMGVSEGEKYTLREILYGLLLPSGNDAAEVIAENTAGSTKNFVNLMNNKANLLGAKDTKFINPSGLQEDNISQYSTAYDMALIARHAWSNYPTFRQVVGTKSFEIPYSEDHKYLYLENQTNLLATYPGVKGIKPGYTPEAGLCLVTLAENDGHSLLAIILGSNDRRGEMIQLLDYSFGSIGVKL